MSMAAIVQLLIVAGRLIERLLIAAAERQKVENLEAIQAAILKAKTAETDEEKRAATAAIKAAFK